MSTSNETRRRRDYSGPLSVVIGAGGTGGHIYPGLAVADALRRLDPEARITFVGTERGLERSLIPGGGYRLHTVDMIPFDRDLGPRRFLLPAYLVHAARQVRGLLAREGAQVVVGMGGYPSAPVVLAARTAGLPALIHESNAVPGRATRLAARLTPHVCLAFDAAAAHLPGRLRPQTVGMPLHTALTRADRGLLRAEARAAFGLAPGRRMVLVSGGSQGAARLTDAAVDLAGRWRARTDVHLVVKTGPAGLARVRERLAENGGAAVAAATGYLERMDLAYAAADLALCRAGSATVAELAVCGLPAVLVPLPHAPGDHQRHNAEVLADAGAALLLRDQEVSGLRLAQLLGPLLDAPEQLAAMGAAADPGTHTQAARRLAGRVMDLAGRRTLEETEMVKA